VSEGDRTFVLVTGSGATSFLWNPLVGELGLRGQRALPVELPGHGFDTVFPAGYGSPQDLDQLATATSPLAGLSLDDYAERTLAIIRRVAEHGPIVLVGHSLGGSTLTRVANTAPDLLARIVYLSAYCCVASPTVPCYAPTQPAPDSPLGRARRTAFLGHPGRIGVSRTNPRTADPEVLAVWHALLMADLNPAQVPAVLAYATQPDEPLQVVFADARVNPATWGRLPRTYIRTSHDEVIPVQVQDRMIAEADHLTPANPFTVHTIAASHFAPITQPAQLADILTSGVGTNRGTGGPTASQ
jgi:pimeloyl-ACP methyl ester carboxylesterase